MLFQELASGFTRNHSYGPGVMNRTNAAWEKPIRSGWLAAFSGVASSLAAAATLLGVAVVVVAERHASLLPSSPLAAFCPALRHQQSK